MTATIAFIGLGNMGLPMAKNLVSAGHTVIGFDMAEAAMEALEAAGGKRAGSASAAAMDAEIVITMLPAGDQVTDVYLGDGGVMKSCQAGTLLIDCSTIDVATARAVAGAAETAGLQMVDAPVSGGVGGLTESDVTLAMTSEAIIFGFNVRADAGARRLSEQEGVEVRYYNVIYDLIDDVKAALSGMLSPEMREEIVGIAEVRDVFRSPKFGQIAGCMVIEGTVYRAKPIRVLRDSVVIYQGELESLRRFKDDASEVRNGMECGIGVKNYNDVKPGDLIEVYEVNEITRTL